MCPGSYSPNISLWAHLNNVVKMKDSQGNNISIGDRVKVLWNYDNKIHVGDVFRISENAIDRYFYAQNTHEGPY